MKDKDDVRLLFMMWGVPCIAYFDSVDQALAWMVTCYEKGWLEPTRLGIWHGAEASTLMEADALTEYAMRRI